MKLVKKLFKKINKKNLYKKKSYQKNTKKPVYEFGFVLHTESIIIRKLSLLICFKAGQKVNSLKISANQKVIPSIRKEKKKKEKQLVKKSVRNMV